MKYGAPVPTLAGQLQRLKITPEEGPPFSAAIAGALRAGDPEALAHVYRVLLNPLTAYLRSQVRDPNEVSDVVQETFIELIRGCRTLTGDPAQIRSWVFRAAQRNAIDHSRYHRRRPELLVAEEPDGPSPQREPADVAVDNDEAERMRLALRCLSVDQAQVLTLRFLAGLPAAEVAAVMGTSVGAVRSLQHRAVAALAKILQEEAAPSRLRPAPLKVERRKERTRSGGGSIQQSG